MSAEQGVTQGPGACAESPDLRVVGRRGERIEGLRQSKARGRSGRPCDDLPAGVGLTPALRSAQEPLPLLRHPAGCGGGGSSPEQHKEQGPGGAGGGLPSLAAGQGCPADASHLTEEEPEAPGEGEWGVGSGVAASETPPPCPCGSAAGPLPVGGHSHRLPAGAPAVSGEGVGGRLEPPCLGHNGAGACRAGDPVGETARAGVPSLGPGGWDGGPRAPAVRRGPRRRPQ